MIYKIVFVIMLCFFTATTVHAKDEMWSDFTKNDWIWQSTATAFHLMDWSLTLDIVKNPETYREMNPLMGDHPSEGTVNTYMAASLVAKWVIAWALPQDYYVGKYNIRPRRTFQVISSVVSFGCVVNNLSIGLTFQLP